MEHRHLNHQRFSLAAIDDIIERGGLGDWLRLRDAARSERELLQKIQQLCATRAADRYAQRHHFWLQYAKRHLV